MQQSFKKTINIKIDKLSEVLNAENIEKFKNEDDDV